jgi:hypothetical protein
LASIWLHIKKKQRNGTTEYQVTTSLAKPNEKRKFQNPGKIFKKGDVANFKAVSRDASGGTE